MTQGDISGRIVPTLVSKGVLKIKQHHTNQINPFAYMVHRPRGTIGVLLCIWSFLIPTLSAWGQTSNPTPVEANPVKQTLETLYEEAATKTLAKMILRKEFFVTVSIKLASKAPEVLPYEPIPDALGKLRSLAPSAWVDYTDQVSITLALNGRFKKTFATKIQDILVEKFALRLNKGDKILISNEWLPSPPDEAASRDIARAELNAAEARRRVTELTDERAKLRDELTQMVAKVDGLQKDLKNRENELQRLQSIDGVSIWRRYLNSSHYIAIALIAIIALSFIALAASRIIGRGISAVAKSLQTVSGSLATINAGGASAELQETNQLPTVPGPESSEGDLSSLYEQVLKIHSEISSDLSEENEYVIISHVTMLCRRSETVPEAVAAMEILGRDKANELFQKLGNQSQQTILEFLRFGRYPRQKAAMLLDAGERVKTRLFAAGFQNTHLRANRKIIKTVANLSKDELISIVRTIDDQTLLARLFMHLESHSLQEIFENLTELGLESHAAFDRAADAFASIPALHYDDDLDQEVSNFINVRLNELRSDKNALYLTYYTQVLESVKDGVSERLLDRIRSVSDSDLAKSIEERVVTFATMGKLAPEFLTMVLESLNNKAIAALCVHEKELAPRILDGLGSWRKQLLQEEISTLESAGRLELEQQVAHAKKLCIGKIRELKASYGLAAMTTADAEQVTSKVAEGDAEAA